MTTGGDAVWCTRCHHMLTACEGRYVHFSDDDWSGGECGCASDLVRCVPEQVYARWAAATASVTAALLRLTGPVTGATAAYAGLAAELKQEDQ